MTRGPKVLVVDDGDGFIELAHEFLRDVDYVTRCELPGPCWTCSARPGCTLTHAHDAAEATEVLARRTDIDAVLLDVVFDLPAERLLPAEGLTLAKRRRTQGLAILEEIRRRRGDLPVVLMTSEESLAPKVLDELAHDELVSLAGADAYDARALRLVLTRALARGHDVDREARFSWGRAPAMTRIRRDIEALAPTSLPMLLLGETGTGKSALAEHAIHPASRRRGRFVGVDLSTIPADLVPAELFGTVRGAFSGATERAGRFEDADGGTLFLDEVGNLSLEAQRALLVAIESGRITRLGEGRARPVDVKIVAATNRDLSAAVRAGEFREDLLARLHPGMALTLPPLRERRGDLVGLVRHLARRRFAGGADRTLLADYMRRSGLDGAPAIDVAFGRPGADAPTHGVVLGLSRASVDDLERHAFPGNLRELDLFVSTVAAVTLSTALTATPASDRRAAQWLPVSARLVRTLLAGARTEGSESAPAAGAVAWPAPTRTLFDFARTLERTTYERLFADTGGDFAAMADRLLDPKLVQRDRDGAARKVRLRFNQLGLRVRGSRKR